MVMPNGREAFAPSILPVRVLTAQEAQKALEQPLLGLQELLLGPAQAFQDGIHQLNATAVRSGFPALPEPPTLPRLLGSDNPGHGRRGY